MDENSLKKIEAFDEEVQHYAKWCLSANQSLMSWSQCLGGVEDAIHEVFIATRNVRTAKPRCRWTTYINNMCLWTLSRLVRKHRRHESVPDVLLDCGESVSVATEKKDLREIMQAEMASRLRPIEQQVIQLRFGFAEEPMTHERIGERMGFSHQNASRVLQTALRKLESSNLLRSLADLERIPERTSTVLQPVGTQSEQPEQQSTSSKELRTVEHKRWDYGPRLPFDKEVARIGFRQVARNRFAWQGRVVSASPEFDEDQKIRFLENLAERLTNPS